MPSECVCMCIFMSVCVCVSGEREREVCETDQVSVIVETMSHASQQREHCVFETHLYTQCAHSKQLNWLDN